MRPLLKSLQMFEILQLYTTLNEINVNIIMEHASQATPNPTKTMDECC